MNIVELDSYNLADAVKFHSGLNPKIWGRDEHLRPEVREKLLAIAELFQEFLGVPDLDVQDITISGSNAAYSYTPNSDIDLHLVVAMPPDPVYQELFAAKKYQFNDEHNIRIGGADVELYVQPSDQQHHSQGIYSVRDGAWISVPRRQRATIDDACVRDKVADLDARIHEAVKSGNESRMTELWNKIKLMRKTGLAEHGEFGCENLAFKLLRNKGCIKLLKDAKTAAEDRALSLEAKKQPPQRVRYGFGESPDGVDPTTKMFLEEPVTESPDGVDPTTKMFLEQPTDESPDGVNPTTAMFLTEVDAESIVSKFIQHTADRLGIKRMPEIHIHHSEDWSKQNHSFGMYVPDRHELHVSLGNRHLLDILRTTAHELCHCAQHEQEPLPHSAGETGSPWENEAHAVAGIVMRDFADAHPEYFKMPAIEESASGYIPKNKREARDPRYSMAVTVDIKPGQVGKEANKLALHTGRNGEPGLLMKTVNLRENKMPQPSQGPGRYRDLNEPLGPEFKPTMPRGTVRVDVSDVYDWYKLGKNIANLDRAQASDFGKGPPSTIVSFGDEDTEHQYIKNLEKLGLTTTDIDPKDPNQPAGMPRQSVDPTYNVDEAEIAEIDRRGVLKALGAGAAAATVPGVGKAGEFVDVKGMAQSQDQDKRAEVEKIWVPRYQELTQRCQDMMKRLIAAAGPQWAPQFKGTKIRVVTNQNYAQSSALIRQIMLDLSVFWDAPDAVLAFAIGHELGHIALDHGGLNDNEADYATKLRLSQQSRQQELDADEFAVSVCRALGYNKSEIFRFIKQNEQEYQELEMLLQSPTSSHPTHRARIERAKQNGFQLSRGGIEQMNALKQHLAEDDSLVENLRQEFELFEQQDLFEIRMSTSSLRQEAAKTGALAGMEFEMIVPNVQGDPGDFESEPDYERDERCRSIEDAVQFFYDGDFNGRRDVERMREKMQEDYLEWLDEKIESEWDNDGEEYIQEWVAHNVDEDEWNPDGLEGSDRQEALEEFAVNVHADPMSDYYKQARDEFREERQDGWDESDWLDDADLDRMTGVHDAYDISWPYYTEPGDEYGEAEISDVAQDFQDSIGRDTYAADSYHSSSTLRPSPSRIRYVVEPDGSLEGDNPGDRGLEFVSPPLPIDEILSDLNKVKAWAKAYGCYTNDSTGLHINISVPDYSRDKLDFVKLALLMGDKYVLDAFGRSGNTYARSAFDIVKRHVRDNPEETAKLLDKMKSNLDSLATKAIHSGVTSKYTSINTKDGHIEFRSPGGDWLDQNFDQIENTLLRFTVAMSAALNPEAYRQEYLTKLYKLLSENNRDVDTIKYFSDYVAGKIPRAALRSFVKQAQLERRLKRDPTEGERYWWRIDKEGRGRDGASIELVAASKKEALEKAREEWRIPAGSTAMSRAEAYPLRPYQETTAQFATNTGLTLNGRPSNPDGRYVIVPEQDRQTVYYRFQAAGPDDANLVLRQWRQAYPGRVWLTLRDDNGVLGQPQGTATPRFGLWDFSEGGFINSQGRVGQGGQLIGGDSFDTAREAARRNGLVSRIDMGEVEIRRIPQQPGQQGQGNWGIWMRDANRFSRAPDQPDNNVLRRFPSREAAEQFIRQGRENNPNMRTDIEVREIEPELPDLFPELPRRSANQLSQTDIENRLGWGGQAADANYEVVNRATMQPVFRFIANTPEEANTKYAQILGAMGMPPETEDYGYRDIVVPGSTIDLQRRLAAQSDPYRSVPIPGVTDVELDIPMADRTDGSNNNYELYNRLTDQVIDTFPARNDSEAQVRLNDFRDFSALARQNPQWDVGVRRGPGVDNTVAQTRDQQQGGIVDVAGETPSATGEFTGNWLILDPDGNEIHRFSGVGNVQSDANRVAMQWLRRNPRHMQDGVEIAPEMSNFPSRGRELVGWSVRLPDGQEVAQFLGSEYSRDDANSLAAEYLRQQGMGVSGEGFTVEPVWREV
jgi:hypothetical protein